MAKAKAKVTTKIKKKFWFPILAPKIFNNARIGESYLSEVSQAFNRSFWHGLKELSGNMRDQGINLNFKIKTGTGSNLNTDIIGYKLTPNSIKKMVRRNNDRSDDSFVVSTSDNKKIRIKTLILTANSTKNSVSTRLKKAMIAKLTEEIKKINFGNLIDKLVSHKLQIETKKFLTKMYPVKIFEIKYMGLEKERTFGTQEQAEEAAEELVEETETPVEEEKPKRSVKKKETAEEKIEEAVEEAEEQAAEKTVEKVVEKEEDLSQEQAEEAAGELVEEKLEE